MKNLVLVVGAIMLFNLSTIVKANENDTMVDMMMMMIKQSGQVSSMSSCLGIKENKFLDGYEKIIRICIPKDGLDGDCIEKLAPKYFAVSEDKIMACGGEDSEPDDEDEIDYAQLSEEERAVLLEKKQAEGLARMEEMAALMKKSSEGTEGEISLPVYSPSTIASHYNRGMKNSQGEVTLPVATLTTKDSVEKVVEFYKKSLPDFEIKNNMGVYYVMDKIPEDLAKLSFDTENLPLYFIPHIETYSLKVAEQDTTFIVISYKPY